MVRPVHGQNHAKARLPSHHLRVGTRRLVERDGLDHGGHPAQRTETERSVSGRRVPRQGTFELAAPEYEIQTWGLDRLRPNAQDDGDTAGTQALEGRGDRLAAGCRYQNDLGAAERLQSRGRVGSAAVDVVVGAELLGQFRRIDATGNRRDLEPHVPGILHTQMSEAADAEHRDKITGLRRRISQRAERRESRAQQRRRIDRRQVVRDRHKPARLCDHDFGISAIMMNASIFLVPTVHEIAIATELAIAARTAQKSDTHALPNRPALDTGTKRVDLPDELVAWDARPIDRELALYRAGIRMTYPACLDTNPDLTRRGRRQLPLHHFQAAGLTRLHCAIACRCHGRLLCLKNGLLPLY